MTYLDITERWRLLSDVHVSDVTLSPVAAETVLVARQNHARINAAAVELTAFGRFARLLETVKRWREFHRHVCRLPSGENCDCLSILDVWLESGQIAKLVEESVSWATLTPDEMTRQAKTLMLGVRRALKVTAKRAGVVVPTVTRNDRSRARLLVTSLTTAPGAPPMGLGLPDLEGFRAA